MSRIFPYLVFILIAGGASAFVFKDRLFPATPDAPATPGSARTGQGGGRQDGRAGGSRRGGNQAVGVLTEKVKTATVPVYLNGVGTVQAFNTAVVRAQVSGRLTEVAFGEGQEVKQGDILARIDPVLYQAAYDQAMAKKAFDEALLENYRKDAGRAATLAKQNYSSQQQADTSAAQVTQFEAQVKQDQAAIDNARATLDYATVRAPISGRTGIRLVDPGNLVSAGDATGIVVIAQLKPISAVFTLPENNVSDILAALAKGTVPIQAITGSEVVSEGKLDVVDNQVDQTTGTVRLKGSFANETNRLWPGEYINVRLQLKLLENAIVVPSVAVQQGANGSFVFLVTPENTAKVTPVKVTQEGAQQSVIAEGIKVGDTVVTSGFASLQDGSRLRLDEQGGDGQGQRRSPSGQDRENPTGGAGSPQTTDKPAGASLQNGPDRQAEGQGRRRNRNGADAAPKDGGERRRRSQSQADTPKADAPQSDTPVANAESPANVARP